MARILYRNSADQLAIYGYSYQNQPDAGRNSDLGSCLDLFGNASFRVPLKIYF